MSSINRPFFYDRVRVTLFGGRMQPMQVQGMEAILNFWEQTSSAKDDRWLAYMLATAYHETARTMQPVRETLAPTDERAIAILDRAFARGQLPWVSNPYWQADKEGKSWLGRGLVQLTHRDNYVRLGQMVGRDLVGDPTLAMRMEVALPIMVLGMEQGAFTGHRLGQYFNGAREDWVKARQIINRMDKALQIADYGKAFYGAISYTTG
ncbi:glycoside hydrolase family 19 protein [Rhizobium sp. RU36D]|uniref:glycoside hydrolase family 19 protein n=1 Tax=Rhizobium sp. RU36D TaxID=1907415 RepID=UPI0009D7CA94|nr:glycoside hydrolase family 19 protein [Rhizobium sp. RU36D]SMD10790.1 Chitinase class I [Rhizobium sp. RU36D]